MERLTLRSRRTLSAGTAEGVATAACDTLGSRPTEAITPTIASSRTRALIGADRARPLPNDANTVDVDLAFGTLAGAIYFDLVRRTGAAPAPSAVLRRADTGAAVAIAHANVANGAAERGIHSRPAGQRKEPAGSDDEPLQELPTAVRTGNRFGEKIEVASIHSGPASPTGISNDEIVTIVHGGHCRMSRYKTYFNC
jgi:hypothetical protein